MTKSLQVGGDGLFQEALNGLLALRGGGGKAGAAAERLRLGHIPAGSTDAVACSLHGTRCATTAALHIALGDRCLCACRGGAEHAELCAARSIMVVLPRCAAGLWGF